MATKLTPKQQELTDKLENATSLRLEGNEAFKAGDIQKALRSYYNVLLNLKGLDQSVNNAFPIQPAEPPIVELEADQVPPLDAHGQPSMQSKIKNTIVTVYCNMAACHAKNANWKRELECSQSALALDRENKKATFREAQARIGLGQVKQGKKLLKELQEEAPDAAVTALLKQLDLEDKERSKKADQSMHGFLMPKKSPAKSNSDAGKGAANGAATEAKSPA